MPTSTVPLLLSLLLAVRVAGSQSPAPPESSKVAAAQPTSAIESRQPKRLCFRGAPLARCRRFLLLEFSAPRFVAGTKLDRSVMQVPSYDRSDQGLASQFLLDVGAMVNIRERDAVGATITYGSVDPGGGDAIGVSGRYRRWLTSWATAETGVSLLRMPVGVMEQQPWGLTRSTVDRPALAADVRLGLGDLVGVTGRAMIANDGRGKTHTALHAGVTAGSWTTVGMGAYVTAMAMFYVFVVGPHGD